MITDTLLACVLWEQDTIEANTFVQLSEQEFLNLLNTPHIQECVQNPGKCARCWAEHYQRKAAWLLNRMNSRLQVKQAQQQTEQSAHPPAQTPPTPQNPDGSPQMPQNHEN